MGYEDFTGYTEVDPNNHIDVPSAHHVDARLYQNEVAMVYKDYGIDHFGNFMHNIAVKWVGEGGIHGTYQFPYMVSNQIGGGNPYYWSPVLRILLREEGFNRNLYLDGTGQRSSAYNLTAGTWYFLTIKKEGKACTCKIYSDSARTNLLATKSITLSGDYSFRYLFGCCTSDFGENSYIEVDVENFDLLKGTISGVTRDSKGNILGGCIVWLFRASDKKFCEEKTSDVNGSFSFKYLSTGVEYFLRAHKDGTPNVFGTTDDNLVS